MRFTWGGRRDNVAVVGRGTLAGLSRAAGLLAVTLGIGGCSDETEPAAENPPSTTTDLGTASSTPDTTSNDVEISTATTTEADTTPTSEPEHSTAESSGAVTEVTTGESTAPQTMDALTSEAESNAPFGDSDTVTTGTDTGTANTVEGCTPRQVSTLESGTLTSYPNISVEVYPSSFRATTINFVITEDGDERGPLLDVYAEIQNISGGLECNILPELTFSAGDLVGIIEFPAYRQQSDIVDYTTLADCLGVGQVGILRANARGITAEDLQQAGSLFIDVTPYNLGFSYELPPEEPEVEATVVETNGGWVVSGTVTPGADIHNYGMYVFPRDANGLLMADYFVAPGNLETLYAGDAAPFESEPSACPFTEYALMHTWILGP